MENIFEHRHTPGITLKLLKETARGYKTEQTEIFKPWTTTGQKHRKPKTKIVFYSREEIKELFKLKF